MSYLDLARSHRTQYEKDERNEETPLREVTATVPEYERNESHEETPLSLDALYAQLHAIYEQSDFDSEVMVRLRSRINQEIHHRKYAERSAA